MSPNEDVALMDGKKVLTLHPQGKKGRSIDRRKYELTRLAILQCLENDDMTQDELVRCVVERPKGKFEGSKGWYMESVKLDLEARKGIERYRSKPRDRYRVVS
ncbi:MAG: hypothetical protein GXY70_02540 [Euryarchaeota archaeon]|nr:hypothetical protein [Euryarchaeota archaeon]